MESVHELPSSLPVRLSKLSSPRLTDYRNRLRGKAMIAVAKLTMTQQQREGPVFQVLEQEWVMFKVLELKGVMSLLAKLLKL